MILHLSSRSSCNHIPHLQPPYPIVPPSSSFGPCMCCYVCPGGRFGGDSQEGLPTGGADPVRKGPACVIHALFPAGTSVHPSRCSWGPCHSCMWAKSLQVQLRTWDLSDEAEMWQSLVLWQVALYPSSWFRATSGGSRCTFSLYPMEGAVYSVLSSFSWCIFALEVQIKTT